MTKTGFVYHAHHATGIAGIVQHEHIGQFVRLQGQEQGIVIRKFLDFKIDAGAFDPVLHSGVSLEEV